ncbi:hypothetical protein [Marivita sp.]|uniref:hypothetical protein n=1 Tax=Marivita sp. TaxID=2003365 RepID=UPI003F6E4E16
MARQRSPGYPNTSLKECIDNIRKIHDQDYTNPVSREVAARHMGYAGTTGTSDRAISALMHFGLLEKVSKGEVRVSQLAIDILFPESTESRSEAIREAANRPVLFGRISAKFPEGQPSDHSLRNYLSREGFVSAAIDPAMKSYLETQQFVQQESASESYGPSVPMQAESLRISEKDKDTQLLSTSQSEPVAPHPSALPVEAGLNKINAEIRGGQVYISALMDLEGLQRLKKKISALEDFLSEE